MLVIAVSAVAPDAIAQSGHNVHSWIKVWEDEDDSVFELLLPLPLELEYRARRFLPNEEILLGSDESSPEPLVEEFIWLVAEEEESSLP